MEVRGVLAASELVYRLGGAPLDEVGGQGLENLVGLHAHVCLAVLEDLDEEVLEVGMRDQVGEHVDVFVGHEGEGVEHDQHLGESR